MWPMWKRNCVLSFIVYVMWLVVTPRPMWWADHIQGAICQWCNMFINPSYYFPGSSVTHMENVCSYLLKTEVLWDLNDFQADGPLNRICVWLINTCFLTWPDMPLSKSKTILGITEKLKKCHKEWALLQLFCMRSDCHWWVEATGNSPGLPWLCLALRSCWVVSMLRQRCPNHDTCHYKTFCAQIYLRSPCLTLYFQSL